MISPNRYRCILFCFLDFIFPLYTHSRYHSVLDSMPLELGYLHCVECRRFFFLIQIHWLEPPSTSQTTIHFTVSPSQQKKTNRLFYRCFCLIPVKTKRNVHSGNKSAKLTLAMAWARLLLIFFLLLSGCCSVGRLFVVDGCRVYLLC